MVNYEVHYLDVSDADAIIIRYEDEKNKYIVLVDAGNVDDSDKIKNYIWNRWGTYTIDLAICTHPDSDHKGGFFGLLNDRYITIKEFWLNTPADVIKEDEYNNLYPKRNMVSHCHECYAHPTDTQSPSLVSLAIEKCNKRVYGAYIGKRHSLIPLSVVGPTEEFYHPLAIEILKNNKRGKDDDNTKYEDIGYFSSAQAKSSIDNETDDCSPTNAGSIILLFEPVKDRKFLLLGDANRAAIMDAISNNENLTGCRIKVPHHGSKHNLTSAIIDKLAPCSAIISAKGSQKHPSRGVVHCLSNHCNVYSTHKSRGLLHTSAPVNNPAIPLKKRQSNLI